MMEEYYKYLPVILTVVLSLSDSFWYGLVHEKLRLLGSWLFKEYRFFEEAWVPWYRLLIQWPLDIAAVYLVYVYCGVWALILMLIGWYFMNKEGNYYVILVQWAELRRYEKSGEHVYWLDRPYFSGSFFFIDGFTVKKFIISYIVSWLFLAASVFINF